tara:strand:+ start:51 stop:284 length:234 start_codon:yes stop_codon:yes gene_type:complete
MYILDYMNNKQQLKETMKTIKIELHSAWQKPEVFEVKDMKVAIEICEAGIDQQYLVYVNGNKYKAMNTFGKTINLNN